MKASQLLSLTWCTRATANAIGRGTRAVLEGPRDGLLVLACAGCAAPFQKVTTPRAAAPEADRPPRIVREATRPTVGVAFGGGSARGIAHVGVIRWLEEHRIPIDVAAGTSMGGLVGGALRHRDGAG